MDIKEQARIDYEAGMKYKEIADKYDISYNTVKSWKTRDKWVRKKDTTSKNNIAPKSAPKKEKPVQNGAPENYYKQLNNSDLNDKQKAFCEEYLACFNATKAYKEVYQVDQETAQANGPRMLGNARVKKVIEQLKKERSTNLFINSNDVLQKLVQMFFVDLNDYIGHGSKKAIDEDTGEEYQRSYAYFKEDKEVDDSLIAQITLGRNGAEVKPYDKIKIAKLLMERLPDAPGEEKENAIIQAINKSIKDNDPVTKDDVDE